MSEPWPVIVLRPTPHRFMSWMQTFCSTKVLDAMQPMEASTMSSNFLANPVIFVCTTENFSMMPGMTHTIPPMFSPYILSCRLHPSSSILLLASTTNPEIFSASPMKMKMVPVALTLHDWHTRAALQACTANLTLNTQYSSLMSSFPNADSAQTASFCTLDSIKTFAAFTVFMKIWLTRLLKTKSFLSFRLVRYAAELQKAASKSPVSTTPSQVMTFGACSSVS
ncbi:Hypothetical_protein [Hexamita inflata]|uniref:Hypothetical_protein n=1 Tax=Hexamita inflata TaxID=28002 RepID=A0AA86RDY3_9EUKA|nr:Hypothetical protein HINF_LOCUS59003 [Hexamita inflata]